MALLQVNHLTKFYGSVAVLTDLNLEIDSGEKWGLIGKNGCGKTTLINILTGKTDYDRGDLHWAQNCRIGYLQQEPEFESDSIYQELRLVFKDLDAIQGRLDRLQERMNEADLSPAVLEGLVAEFTQLNEAFAQQDGYQIEGRIQGVLRGLGFPKERWEDSPQQLSGGERTRLALAGLLLTANDLLFLDEPTNYLDLAALEWLERYLQDYRGAVLVISHDRYFLDQVVDGYFEIEAGKAVRFRGDYQSFRQSKNELTDATWKAYLKQEKRLSKLEKFVREARATQKSKRQAHSIAKRLEKEVRIEKPTSTEKKIKMAFKTTAESSYRVLEAEGLAKSYGDQRLFEGVGFTINAGDKVGLIGPNGVGKTTLLKILLELEPADRGTVRFGYEVFPGYFSQMTTGEDLEGTPFSQVMAAADLDNTEARTILGRFLFSGDDALKPVVALSGGERRRLGLIKLMLSQANLLIMDEPTNHLDLQSIEVIEAALLDYEGTILVVSHDRYFLNKVANRFLALSNGQIHEFGSYREYLDGFSQPSLPSGTSAKAKSKLQSQHDREIEKERQRQLRRLQRDVAATETEIHRTEERKAAVVALLEQSEVHSDYQQSMTLSAELAHLDSVLDELYLKWEAAHEALEQF
jgi:ATP-binding cassette subfamily F protein 3